MALVVKNLPANGGDQGSVGSIPGLERSPGGGHGNPLQYSCLENPMDRGAWQTTVHRLQSWTRVKRLSMHIIYPLSFLCVLFHLILIATLGTSCYIIIFLLQERKLRWREGK